MLRKINQRYLNWYNNNPEKIIAICILNLIIDTVILILLALNDRYDWFIIVIWLCGLSLANLAVEWKRYKITD